MNGLTYVYMIINLFEIIIMLSIKYVLLTSTRRINPKDKVWETTNFIRSKSDINLVVIITLQIVQYFPTLG
jgi:hypothetical protein